MLICRCKTENCIENLIHISDSGINAKRPKSECPYAEKCFRLNPIHFREYSHAHCKYKIV